MKTEPRLSWTQLEKLFTVIMCISDEGEILYSSETPKRYIPTLSEGSQFFELFKLLRPAGARNIAEVRKHLSSLFLVKSVGERFAMRGQMVETTWEGRDVLCFCGSPWVFWMNAHCPDIKLGMGDFSAQDSQLDQLFLMTTEQRMVSDLEKLNSELQHAKQDTEAAQMAKNALFARMSHEMRTPLNGVVSALSLLGDHKMNTKAEELLALANSSSRNLLHVINYILDISKIEAGDEVFDSTIFEMTAMLRGVTDIVRARAVEKNLELIWSTSPLLSDLYIGDKSKLRQCLLNLITNAIKFTDVGSVTVRALPSASEDSVRFEVEDTGAGIGVDDKHLIFEPFWTGMSDTLGRERGTGLGLDLVRRYVDVMGGTLGVASHIGRGSLFWFEVPLEIGIEEASTDLGSAPQTQDVPTRFDGRVLLVDDNSTNMLLGRLILESLGVTVEEACDGAMAVEKALKEPFDLVLMDLNMPVMDGVAATAKIRKHRNEDALPVVALTAYASSEEKERCLRIGMNDYLTKPIVRDRLAEQLNRWLTADNSHNEPEITASVIEEANDSNAPPILAKDILDELRAQIGDASLGDVLDQFEAEVHSRWEAFSEAFMAAELGTMIREVHTLASTCRSLGLAQAGEHFAMLEQQMRDSGNAVSQDDVSVSDGLLRSGLKALGEYRKA
ncbi:response regulator [Congregibacter variabilis]|uniref:histidine kinase n=1 Tax=Congregibacter variabilis TaxID=3081200 RepID=A0ABZ0HY51_9GAMM|nr:response regulator [Congregibacter sp. IMCC43200]